MLAIKIENVQYYPDNFNPGQTKPELKLCGKPCEFRISPLLTRCRAWWSLSGAAAYHGSFKKKSGGQSKF